MPRALTWMLALAAALTVGTWVVLAALRVGHPFELEWLEGGMLAHVERVRAGQPLYASPSLEFTAFPYPPLLPWLAAGLGGGFSELRGVSIAATLALFVALARVLAGPRRARSPLAAWVAVGLFAAGYRWAGAWFDVGKPDMLSLAFLLPALALPLARSGTGAGTGAALAGGALAYLAVLAKQIALVPALALGAGLLIVRRRQGLAFLASLAALVALTLWIGDARSEGWFSFYAYRQLLQHQGHDGQPLRLFVEDLPRVVPGLVLLGIGWSHGRERCCRAAAGLGLLLAAWLGRSHIGGFDNTLLPALLAIAWGAGAAVRWAHERGGRSAHLVGGLALLQFALFAYDPRAQVPGSADARAGERLVEELRAVQGEVLVPAHGYLARRAGKSPAVHWMALLDLSATGDGDLGRALVGDLEAGLAAGRWEVVVLNAWVGHEDQAARALFERHLRLERSCLPAQDRSVLRPVTGAPRRPELWYVRR